jgi:hypothetical protein
VERDAQSDATEVIETLSCRITSLRSQSDYPLREKRNRVFSYSAHIDILNRGIGEQTLFQAIKKPRKFAVFLN